MSNLCHKKGRERLRNSVGGWAVDSSDHPKLAWFKREILPHEAALHARLRRSLMQPSSIPSDRRRQEIADNHAGFRAGSV